jgi:hypothetical protein
LILWGRQHVANLTFCATKAWPDKVNNQQTFNHFRGREKPSNEDDLHTAKNFFGGRSEAPPFFTVYKSGCFDSGYFEVAQSIRKENVVTKSGSRHSGYDTN